MDSTEWHSSAGFPPELVCPAVTADIAVFMIRKQESDSYRKDTDNKLSILLIRRRNEPFRGMWALPGGFLRWNESIEECAEREFSEETGVAVPTIVPVDVFSKIGRDPRGRVISHAFTAVINDEPGLPKGDTDADDARWFDIRLVPMGNDRLELTLKQGDIELRSVLRSTGPKFGHQRFEIETNAGISFDHAEIIASALTKLRSIARYPEAILDLLPERFTLTELQRVQETITEAPTGMANFRRKIASYVEETDEYLTGVGHRPARLYTRKHATEETK